MKFFLPALLLGFIINLFILKPGGGFEIYPEWIGSIKQINSIEKSLSKEAIDNTIIFPVNEANSLHVLASNGQLKQGATINNSLMATSGNGLFYIAYQKVGKEIEFFNVKGERFWKLQTREYPYLSYDSKVVALMIGDHSRIRIADYNGNIISERPIYGRLCNVISFSPRGANVGIGFIDGSYYIINSKGKIVCQGKAPDNLIIKGIAISNNGFNSVIHYGDDNNDYLKIIIGEKHNTVDLLKQKVADTVKHAIPHKTKTAMYITNDGITTFLDRNKIIQLNNKGRLSFYIVIKPKREGIAAIDCIDGYYSVSYTMESGEVKFLVFRQDGLIVYSKELSSESFAMVQMKQHFIFLRGSDSLFCYRIHAPKD